MSEHLATIRWERSDSDFLKGKFSRIHTWTFDGGAVIQASPSPSVVMAPYSDAALVDPEEALVAAISSCHMLTFLHFAARKGFQVDSYEDAAVGMMTKNAQGVPWMSAATLRPKVVYSGDKRPTGQEEQELHHMAHEKCFIAQSVKTEVTVALAE